MAKLTNAQLVWLRNYEAETTFEPMEVAAIVNSSMTFNEVAQLNIKWFGQWSIDALHAITVDVPGNESEGE